MDALTTVGALDRLGYSCRDNGLLFSINAHMWTVVMPMLEFGTAEQKAEFLPALCDGSLIGANATSEPDAGSDAYRMRTTAVKEGDSYVLNGSKIWVTNGPIADVVFVYATANPDKGVHGISAFIVDMKSPGLSVSKATEKMGLRTSPMAELFFDQCVVPASNRIGPEGAGSSLFTYSMTCERGSILSNGVGAMQYLLDACIQFSKERKQFGQSIGKFQSVSNKIVEMKIRLETSRNMLYHCGWLRSNNKRAILEAAMTKLYISDCWVKSCQDAMQIFGAAGYMVEYGLERELRDAMASRIYSGTSEIQRNIIASMLGVS
jgi:alkylation response protein AidB-like acyl-CoA dehydrogenase